MTQQQKNKLRVELSNQTEIISNIIEERLDTLKDETGTILHYLQLVATQNQIIILNQTPVTNDIQNPLHY